MATYGRNLTFRMPPRANSRAGRFSVPATGTAIPLGAPIVADLVAGVDALGNQIVKLAPNAAPIAGLSGIAVYEYAPAAYAGTDPLLTTYSDLGTVPLGKMVQVVSGATKVVFANTVAETFLGVRSYPGRIMVAGLTAVTPTVVVGQYLIPGTGDDVNGYWTGTATAAGAWMVVTAVDPVRVQVEARMLF